MQRLQNWNSAYITLSLIVNPNPKPTLNPIPKALNPITIGAVPMP